MSEKPSDVPVLIVGAGAAGTMLALELARFGVDFRLIDRLPAPSPYSKAVTVHARTLECLERADPALAQRFLDLGIHCPGYIMHFVGQDKIRREVRPGLDFRSLPSRYPFLLLNAQNDTEQLIRGYTEERYGLKPQWGSTCSKVELEEDGVLAMLRHADGGEENVRARYLVACDGAGSRIRQQLNLIQEGSDYAGTVLQNLDIEIENFPDEPDWAHYCMGPGHFIMVVRLPRGHFRLLMSQPADKADEEETPQRVFSDILAQHFDGLKFGKTVWHSRWQSFIRLAKSYRKGNVFLAGDAAHIHSTAGGQGMNCCMQDAYNLGWKLAYVLQGKANAALLDTYESERKPIGAQVIAAASEIHELFMAGRTSTPDEMLALQRSGKLEPLVGKVSGIAYHYRPEQAQAGDAPGGLQAGDRAPDADLPQKAGARVFDYTRHAGFTLLAAVPEGAAAAEAEALLAQFQRQFPSLLRTGLLSPAPAVYAGRNAGTRLFLLRPDGYIGVHCAAGNPGPVREFLQAL